MSVFSLRGGLIFLQLFASVTVLTITLLMLKQLDHISATDMGFKTRDQIVVPIHTADIIEKIPLMKQRLLELPDINGVTASTYLPGGRVPTVEEKIETSSGLMEPRQVKQFLVDKDFLATMELEIVEGNGFSDHQSGESLSPVIVNEALVKAMGWVAPLGKRIEVYDRQESRVVGVVKDFHYWSLHQAIEPLRLLPFREHEFDAASERQRKNAIRFLTINIVPGATMATINRIKAVVKEFDPQHPFEYQILQDLVDQFYQDEHRQIQFTIALAAVCILITGLGLLGFIAFTTEQQSKAIGIRIVLGVSRARLILHFLLPVLGLLGLASILGSAVSYIAIQQWITGFSYRAPMPVSIYLLSCLVVAILVCVTVTLKLLRAIAVNPVELLRHE